MFEAYLSIGSNLGNKFKNIQQAICLLLERNKGTKVLQTSYLRKTKPMYVLNQPSFLNGAVHIKTLLGPHDLLKEIKIIEKQLGRCIDESGVVRNGPRPIDVDILFYGSGNNKYDVVINDEKLVIPHDKIQERNFVLEPLMDMDPNLEHPVHGRSIQSLFKVLNEQSKEEKGTRVIPLPSHGMMGKERCISFEKKQQVMGILNATPDSFSDGGEVDTSVDLAVQKALQLIEDGATIIDIGGESTRPGASEVSVHDQLNRVLPVIQALRKDNNSITISIDTRHSMVAKEAVVSGADIVNDVSAGSFDPNMLSTVHSLNAPIILMHMRGIPKTMQSMTTYNNIIEDVSSSLLQSSQRAHQCNIYKWQQILDPGIGFAKDFNGNLHLLKHYDDLRQMMNNPVMVLGTSRKGFIGKIINENQANKRDVGSVSSIITTLMLSSLAHQHTTAIDSSDIIRVHNVKAMKQGLDIMNAICNS